MSAKKICYDFDTNQEGKKVVCLTQIQLDGTTLDKVTTEKLENYKIPFCVHRMSPGFIPTCAKCFKENEHSTWLVDKDGHKTRFYSK